MPLSQYWSVKLQAFIAPRSGRYGLSHAPDASRKASRLWIMHLMGTLQSWQGLASGVRHTAGASWRMRIMDVWYWTHGTLSWGLWMISYYTKGIVVTSKDDLLSQMNSLARQTDALDEKRLAVVNRGWSRENDTEWRRLVIQGEELSRQYIELYKQWKGLPPD